MTSNISRNKIIVLGSDHNGVEQKRKIKHHLIKMGYTCIDLGSFSDKTSVDYSDYAYQVGTIVANNDANFGILICGTGIGMSIAANRIPNIRAALVHNIFSAKKSREHNDSNILCLGSWINNIKTNLTIIDNWINTPFGQERHIWRTAKISSKMNSKIVLCIGAFNQINSDDIDLFKHGNSLGKLIIAIPSDSFLHKWSHTTEIQSKNDFERKHILLSIKWVNEVLVFNEFIPKKLITLLKPDILLINKYQTKNIKVLLKFHSPKTEIQIIPAKNPSLQMLKKKDVIKYSHVRNITPKAFYASSRIS